MASVGHKNDGDEGSQRSAPPTSSCTFVLPPSSPPNSVAPLLPFVRAAPAARFVPFARAAPIAPPPPSPSAAPTTPVPLPPTPPRRVCLPPFPAGFLKMVNPFIFQEIMQRNYSVRLSIFPKKSYGCCPSSVRGRTLSPPICTQSHSHAPKEMETTD